jgi:hypothetical protein
MVCAAALVHGSFFARNSVFDAQFMVMPQLFTAFVVLYPLTGETAGKDCRHRNIVQGSAIPEKRDPCGVFLRPLCGLLS